MKYVIQECFTDDMDVTFQKSYSQESKSYMYTMWISKSVFELITKEKYEIAVYYYDKAFKARMKNLLGFVSAELVEHVKEA